MNRTDVIQKILDKKRASTYLEIGVSKGINFFPIKALHKIAVDPCLTINAKDKVRWLFKNPCNLLARYYPIDSDSYFAEAARSNPPDVVFIDGLHSYQQSLRDVLHSLDHLKEKGVIVIHDCHPPDAASAHPADSLQHATTLALPGWTGNWCGDVWKTICHLRSERNDLTIFVLDCDFGLGIITKGKAENNLSLSVHDIEKMTYCDFPQNSRHLLNLKEESYLFEFLQTL